MLRTRRYNKVNHCMYGHGYPDWHNKYFVECRQIQLPNSVKTIVAEIIAHAKKVAAVRNRRGGETEYLVGFIDSSTENVIPYFHNEHELIVAITHRLLLSCQGKDVLLGIGAVGGTPRKLAVVKNLYSDYLHVTGIVQILHSDGREFMRSTGKGTCVYICKIQTAALVA